MATVISVAVMAHPKREAFVAELTERLDREPEIAWDTDDDRWETGRRALLSYDPKASHHLVIQDDAVIPERLVEGCEMLTAHVPEGHPVSLYMGKARARPKRYSMRPMVQQAQRIRASFMVFPGPWWGVGIILPVSQIEVVVEYGDENPRNQPNYDLRIAQWYADQGIECWYTAPSVVNHRTGHPSLTGRTSLNRVAMWHTGKSPADTVWTDRVVRPTDPRFPTTP